MCRLGRDEHKDIFGALGISACHKFAANDNAAFRESDFFADLQHPLPARPFHGWTNELGADIPLAQVFLVDGNACCHSLEARKRSHSATE